jgi:hypothetical protein
MQCPSEFLLQDRPTLFYEFIQRANHEGDFLIGVEMNDSDRTYPACSTRLSLPREIFRCWSWFVYGGCVAQALVRATLRRCLPPSKVTKRVAATCRTPPRTRQPRKSV